MIMPGVQKPHCRPCFSQKPCWIGCSSPSLASPSIVMMSAPSHWTANRLQAFTAWPSMMIVQAPHWLVSAHVGPGQPDVLSDVVDEQQARLDLVGDRLAVDRHLHWQFHGSSSKRHADVETVAGSLTGSERKTARRACQRPPAGLPSHRAIVPEHLTAGLGASLVEHLAHGQRLLAGDAGHLGELGGDRDDPPLEARDL